MKFVSSNKLFPDLVQAYNSSGFLRQAYVNDGLLGVAGNGLRGNPVDAILIPAFVPLPPAFSF
jgi:hypothetical protein